MGLNDLLPGRLFRAKPKLSARADLVDWLDGRAAFLIQKGIHEYSRARAGIHWQAIYQEQLFIEALDIARWRSFPLGLAMVGELVEGVLRPLAGLEPPALAARVSACALEAFDRHPVFAPVGEADWAAMRADLARRIAGTSLHPVKPVKDISLPFGEMMFALMPMHPDIKQQDSLIVRSHLRTSLIAMHRDLTAAFDLPALARAIAAA